jgi:hypothetical protein
MLDDIELEQFVGDDDALDIESLPALEVPHEPRFGLSSHR